MYSDLLQPHLDRQRSILLVSCGVHTEVQSAQPAHSPGPLGASRFGTGRYSSECRCAASSRARWMRPVSASSSSRPAWMQGFWIQGVEDWGLKRIAPKLDAGQATLLPSI